MINWIAGQWPDRFRCLVNHDGVFDQRIMYYATEELWFPEWEFGGPYWENPEAYEQYNPVELRRALEDPDAGRSTARLDYRVPETQGLGAFTALQRRGIPSRLLYFPDENHWVLSPANSLLWHDDGARLAGALDRRRGLTEADERRAHPSWWAVNSSRRSSKFTGLTRWWSIPAALGALPGLLVAEAGDGDQEGVGDRLVAADLLGHLVARQVGQVEVEEDRRRADLPGAGQGLLAGGGGGRLAAGRSPGARARAREASSLSSTTRTRMPWISRRWSSNSLSVLDVPSSSVTGRITRKVLPRSAPSLRADTAPSCISTICLTRVRPMPEAARERSTSSVALDERARRCWSSRSGLDAHALVSAPRSTAASPSPVGDQRDVGLGGRVLRRRSSAGW